MIDNRIIKGLVVVIILFFVATVIIPSSAQDLKRQSNPIIISNILYVGGSGPGNYTRIQDAINNSSDGDTVFVYDDSSPYKENIYVNKSIKVQGENMTSTIIFGFNCIVSDFVIISGFTFKQYGFPTLSINGFSNNIIENCAFTNGSAGLDLEKSDNNIIRNCSFKHLEFGILQIWSSDNNEICYCDFIDNPTYFPWPCPAIDLRFSRGIKIHHCNITRNYPGGVRVMCSNVKMNYNNIFNNYELGVQLQLSSCDMRNNWWGGPNGPNIYMYIPFFEMHWGLGPIYFKKVDVGESVVYGSLFSLIGINRVFPWLSEPVADAGQQIN